MTVRAVRGAVQVDSADRDAILEATAELVSEVMSRNDLTTDDVISVLFTTTPDLTAEFPALAARKIGFHDVPLICAAEIAVPGAMPRVVRLMAHIETDRPRSAIQHVYLRGAAALRLDIARREQIAAYMVFADRTLIEMARQRPASLAGLKAIHGVGEMKLARYGETFLKAIATEERRAE